MADISLLWTGAAASSLGVAFWIADWTSGRNHAARCAGLERAKGVVSKIGRRGFHSRNKPSFDDSGVLVSVVTFRASNGVEYAFDAPDAPRTVGAAVDVAYDPAAPSGALLVTRVPKIGCSVVLLLAGVALIVAAFFR